MKQVLLKAALISLGVMASQKLFAQAEDALLRQLSSASNMEKSLKGVVVNQDGLRNEAFIFQVTETNASGIKGFQSGNENQIQLMQTGNYVAIRIFQEGSENSYDADIEGQDAKIDITQHGFENIIFQSLLLNNTGISIHQEGDRNEVVHTGTSTDSGIQIQQQGFGMRLIIQSN